MQTAQTAAAGITGGDGREPLILTKRIGSTTFIINVETSPSATETPEQKLLRLIESEVTKSA